MEASGQLAAPATLLRYTFNRRQGGLWLQSGHSCEEKNLCPYRESNRDRPSPSAVTLLISYVT
jgi:hypothetical protein